MSALPATNLPQRTAAEESLGASLPSRRLEEWKWTDLRRLVTQPYGRAPIAANDSQIDRLLKLAPLATLKMQRIVLVNGILDEARSDLRGLKLSRGAPDVTLDDPLVVLNRSGKAEGITLAFDGTEDRLVEVLHVSSGAELKAVSPRLHIAVSAGATATIVETFVGEGDYLVNPLTSVRIEEGARLDRVKLERDAAPSRHLSQVIVDLAAKAIFNEFTLTSGAAVSRQNGNISFFGEGANARVAGAYLLADEQHVDTRLVVDHRVPHCTSRELFKCVMQDRSRGIFQGKVIVRPDAQKTDGKQSSHALLLSEQAEFDAKPELEIYADDVVCGHGSTAGDINHDHMFYLRSRGIPEAEARSLLVQAFVVEAIGTVENETLRDALADVSVGLMKGASS